MQLNSKTMKSKILLLLTLVTFLTACETNDNNIIISEADLIGTWNLTKQTVENGSFTVSAQGQTINANYSAVTKDIDFRYTFSQNPNQLNFDGKYTLVATVNVLGVSNSEEQEVDTNQFPMTSANWSLDRNTLTFTDSQDIPAVLNVVAFSGNYLKLQGDFNETQSFNGDTVTVEGTIIIELSK